MYEISQNIARYCIHGPEIRGGTITLTMRGIYFLEV